MLRIAALVLALAALPLPAAAASDLDSNAVVYCFDADRDLVQRVRVRHCAGRIVSPREAAEIHTRIEAERNARRTRSIALSRSREAQRLEFHSAGAAFAVNGQGELLTSAHVVRGCTVLEAHNDLTSHPFRARVKVTDEARDLAVLQISRPTGAFLRFAPLRPQDGEPLALIGYPAEGMIRMKPRLTPVLISHAISHPAKYGLTGIAGEVRSGNSGGPALDSRGRAVGVLKAKVNSVAARRLTGRTLHNLGVFVDTPRVIRFLEASRTPYSVDRSAARELSGKEIFGRGSQAVYRIDCLKRR